MSIYRVTIGKITNENLQGNIEKIPNENSQGKHRKDNK